MLEVLYHYFERSFPLTETDKALIKSVVSSRKIKKGEFLVRAGEVAKFGAFVTKGFLRSYVIDNKGKEHIMQFAPENWWISDKTGMSEGTPATFFIDAIEDSELILMDLAGHLTLVGKIARLFRFVQGGNTTSRCCKGSPDYIFANSFGRRTLC